MVKEKIKSKIKKLKTDGFWKSLFKNSFWAFAGESIASVIGLAVTIVLIKIIGGDNYGALVLGQSYMSIMDVLINVQSWKSIIQYGQKCIVEKNIKKLHSYVKLGTILDVSTAVLCMVVAYCLANVIGRIFGWSEDLVMCAKLFSLTIVSHFAGTPTAILRIYDKFHLVALQKFIGASIKLTTLILLLVAKGELSLRDATIAYCVTDVINNIVLVVFALIVYRKKAGLRGVLSAKMPDDKSDFIRFTLWGTVSEIVDVPVNYFDMFIVSLLGNSYVSIYKVFKQFVGILQKVISPIKQAILPQFSELSAQKNEKRGFEVVEKIHKTVMIIGMPISLVAGLTSLFWLDKIYGPEYATLWYVLLFYLLIQTYALSYSTIHPYFLSLDQSKRSALYVLISNVVYMIIAFAATRYVGLLGMVIAFLIQCVLAIELKKRYIKKILRSEK